MTGPRTSVIDLTVPFPREKVFAAFADHQKLGRILGLGMARVRDGDDARDPNGRGSVRKVSLVPGVNLGAFEETVLTSNPPSLLEYTISGGLPIKHHHGRVEFHEAGANATRIHYTIELETALAPVTALLAKGLELGIGFGIRKRLAKVV